MSADTLTHPAARSVHAVNNVLQIALAVRDRLDDGDDSPDPEDVARMIELLTDVPADVAALHQNIERLEEDLDALCRQGIADANEITELRRQLSERNDRLALASREVEQLLQAASIHLQGARSDFNRIRSLRDTLDSSRTTIGRGGEYALIHDTSRAAAAGGQ